MGPAKKLPAAMEVERTSKRKIEKRSEGRKPRVEKSVLVETTSSRRPLLTREHQLDSGSEDDAGELHYDDNYDDEDLNYFACDEEYLDYFACDEEWMNESTMHERVVNEEDESMFHDEGIMEDELVDSAGGTVGGLMYEDDVMNVVGDNGSHATVYENFSWSADYSKFSGHQESYMRTPGPLVSNNDPLKLFKEVWDERIMKCIAEETNRYAWQTIAPLSETEGGIPTHLDNWYETTVDEMYRYFAILILMSFCNRSRINEYWLLDTPLTMPDFGKLMSRNRFQKLTHFLHFVDNYQNDLFQSSYEKKIFKIRPLLDHCNSKFAAMYAPNQHLSLDESLPLWKGRLNWVQCIRSKAARFGIKMYILCEAVTGYQLKCLLYAGKGSNMHEKTNHGFENTTAKVVLDLMDGYLDIGHTLVMDNWYNQLPLTRLLKQRKTDVIGTINPRAQHVPEDIKCIIDKNIEKGKHIARHCGDISIVLWQDVKLVTTVSTYHSDEMVITHRKGKAMLKPACVIDYNKYMGDVDMKDQKLSMFLLERKRALKWYIKVFKRLLNTSLLNAYIIYQKNTSTSRTSRTIAYRDFRLLVALELLKEHPRKKMEKKAKSVPVLPFMETRLQPLMHFPKKMKIKNGHRLQKLCQRCLSRGKRYKVTVYCGDCEVGLCLGDCWLEYHTLLSLK